VNSHQAGTVRTGVNPAADVPPRTYDVDNLYVVDSSFFPSLPVINPALTIAANAFRWPRRSPANPRPTASGTTLPTPPHHPVTKSVKLAQSPNC
jgi:choline dehydrogenase-like flavoprotein